MLQPVFVILMSHYIFVWGRGRVTRSVKHVVTRSWSSWNSILSLRFRLDDRRLLTSQRLFSALLRAVLEKPYRRFDETRFLRQKRMKQRWRLLLARLDTADNLFPL